jgi:hypothetical protein
MNTSGHSNYEIGSTVTWIGAGSGKKAKGTIQQMLVGEPIELTLKDGTIESRTGIVDDNACIINKDDGSKLVLLESELAYYELPLSF